MGLKERYGILVNDEEWDLLYRSVTFRRDSVEEITGHEPEDLKKLAEDLLKIKDKGYIKVNKNMVTEKEARQRFFDKDGRSW
jgi:NADPH-dependent 2,4-dienoyl-CoA reductase/sulfur reductase-like enzyme